MSITKQVHGYIEGHPSIRDCIDSDIINFSALARKVIKETQLKGRDFDGIVMACRRYFDKRKSAESQERKIISILERSKLEIKTKIAVVILNKGIDIDSLLRLEKEARKKGESFHIVEGTRSITLLITEDMIDDVKRFFRHSMLMVNKDLSEIIVRSPEEIENVPGLIAYITTMLAENGINVVEMASCWTDTLLVIDETSVAKAMKLLNRD